MREQFYLALPMKPLCRDECRGLCSHVRRQPEPRRVRLRADLGGSQVRGAESPRRKSHRDAESQTTTLQDADGQAPHARRADGRGPQRVPAVPRDQAAAPCVPELRPLPRPSGAGRQRGVIWIAVDALGGDLAPGPIVAGALAAARHFDLGVVLVGPRERLTAELATVCITTPIVCASSRPTMSSGWPRRRRPRSRRRAGRRSGWRPTGGARRGRGPVQCGAHRRDRDGRPRRIRDDRRASTARRWRRPFRRGSNPAVLLDVGASVECRPAHLLQFAAMGSVYARVSFGIESPRVGLLSIGEEESKGNELTRDAHQLLKALNVRGDGARFVGNIEAREVYSGGADVIVCDGFTGQHRAQDQRRARRDGVGADCTGTGACRAATGRRRRSARVGPRPSAWRVPCGGSAAGWTMRSTAAPRSSAWPASRSSATVGRARGPCGTPWRWRTGLRPAGSSIASRARSRTQRCLTSDCLHLSRTGLAEGRHGQGAGRGVSRSVVKRSRKPMPRSASRSAGCASRALRTRSC